MKLSTGVVVRGLALSSALVLPMVGHAAIDTADAEASIADAVTAITAVGGLLIGAAAVAMALRWVKAMFF